MHRYLWFATAALLLAGCSRHGATPVAAAAAATPEPVDRTVPVTAATQPQPVTPPSVPPQGMYPQPQAGVRAVSGQPLNAATAAPVQPANIPPQPPAAGQPLSAYGQPAGSQPVNTQPAPAEPTPGRTFDGPMIPAGTRLRVRLDEPLGTKHDRSGERFYATLASPVVEDGRTLLPVGTRFVGRLTESKPSGRLKGRAILAVRLDAFDWRGRQYSIDTSSIARATRKHKRHDLRWIAGGGGAGAVIGAIAGGGGGALIGAAAGAGAGTAGALITGKKQVYLAAETPLTFRLRTPVQM